MRTNNLHDYFFLNDGAHFDAHPTKEITMPTQVIHTDLAPAAIGPYSQAVSINLATADKMVFCSGQIGLDPATGNLREGFEAQVDQALANMQAVIAAAHGNQRCFNLRISTHGCEIAVGFLHAVFVGRCLRGIRVRGAYGVEIYFR